VYARKIMSSDTSGIASSSMAGIRNGRRKDAIPQVLSHSINAFDSDVTRSCRIRIRKKGPALQPSPGWCRSRANVLPQFSEPNFQRAFCINHPIEDLLLANITTGGIFVPPAIFKDEVTTSLLDLFLFFKERSPQTCVFRTHSCLNGLH